ncbi:hypothetical protein BU17DRAFT_88717 [Hysterangium stoloniferum]|nr:hypothetical protein BU17DRAFT_88717 [Hysterangium stoloniferum]
MLNDPNIQASNESPNRNDCVMYNLTYTRIWKESHWTGLSRRRGVEGDMEDKDGGWTDDGYLANGVHSLFAAFLYNHTAEHRKIDISHTQDGNFMDSQLPLVFDFLSLLQSSLLEEQCPLSEIITDNGTPFVLALDWLTVKYHIHRINIFDWNKQDNGIVERSHHTIHKSIAKGGQHLSKDTDYSLFYVVDGIEFVPAFDVVEATHLVPKIDSSLATAELIAAA